MARKYCDQSEAQVKFFTLNGNSCDRTAYVINVVHENAKMVAHCIYLDTLVSTTIFSRFQNVNASTI